MKVPQPKKLPSGNWFIRLRLGGDDIGITCATPKECRRQAQLIKAEHLAGKRQPQAKSSVTLREACASYIAAQEKANHSPETIRGYDIIMRKRFQDVIDLPVSAITDWQAAYDKDAARLSPKSMENAWRFIRSVCKHECGITLPEISTVKRSRPEHAFLEPEDIKRFVAEAAKDKHAIPLLLCLSSCRSSEVQGLEWSQVDLDHNRIRITQTMVQNKDREYVTKAGAKTAESARYIPLFIPELKAALQAVPDKTGKVVKVRPNSVYRRANQICERLGLPPVGQHGLRHSFASLCFSLDVPAKITQQIGGWKDDQIVMEIYTHLSKKHMEDQLGKLQKFFAPKENGNENGNSAASAAQ